MLREWVGWSADELVDPRVAGFIRAVSAVMTEPQVVEALAADERVQREGLQVWIARAQQAAQVRRDLSAEVLANWLALVLDGFAGRIATEPSFSAGSERATLLDTVDRLLADG